MTAEVCLCSQIISRDISLLMVIVQTGPATVEISIGVSHKSGNHVADDPDIQLIFIYPKKSVSHPRDIFSSVYCGYIKYSQKK